MNILNDLIQISIEGFFGFENTPAPKNMKSPTKEYSVTKLLSDMATGFSLIAVMVCYLWNLVFAPQPQQVPEMDEPAWQPENLDDVFSSKSAEVRLNKDNFLQRLSSSDRLKGDIIVEGKGINSPDALTSLDSRSIRAVETAERLSQFKIDENNLKGIDLGNVKTNLEAIKNDVLKNASDEDTQAYVETLMDQTIYKIEKWRQHLSTKPQPVAEAKPAIAPIVKAAPVVQAVKKADVVFNADKLFAELENPNFLKQLSNIEKTTFLKDKGIIVPGKPSDQNEPDILKAAKDLAALKIDPSKENVNFAALRNQLRALKDAMIGNVNNTDVKLQIGLLMDQVIRKASFEQIRKDIRNIEFKKTEEESKVTSLDQSEETQQKEIVEVMKMLFKLEINSQNMYEYNLDALKRIAVMIKFDFPFITKGENQRLQNLISLWDGLNRVKFETSFNKIATLLGGTMDMIRDKATGSDLFQLNLEKTIGTFGDIVEPGETWASGGTLTFPSKKTRFKPDFENMKITTVDGNITGSNVFGGNLTDITFNQNGSFTFNITSWPVSPTRTYSYEALKATFGALEWE